MRGTLLIWTAVAGLAASGPASGKSNRPMGIWGGPHAGADFHGGLTDLQFDCASGTIDDAVVPGRDGSFSVKGTYRTGPSGPVKVGQFFTSTEAFYSGQIAKGASSKDPRTMTVTVNFEDGSSLGPFTLTEGMPPELTHCR